MKSQVTGGLEIQQTPAKKQRQTHQKGGFKAYRVTDSLPKIRHLLALHLQEHPT